MKIIIVGAGEVGRHLAKMLANENQDIILMDNQEDRLEELDTQYDLMTKVGEPTSLKDLRECGVKGCDLFVAVTPYESVNMTACMLASNMGAQKTVARIDNYEYLLPTNLAFFKKMGIDSLIYPELLAAKEIVASLGKGWIREYRTFENEALVLVCLKIRDNSQMLNKQFSTGYFGHNQFRIVAIRRANETIIPNGSDEVKNGDIVYFICTKENLNYVRKEGGKEAFEIHNVMFIGASNITRETMEYLPSNITSKIIEIDRDRCYEFAEEVNEALIIQGDGRNLDLLKEEGIEDMDAFIAVTANSEANVLACMAAKRFHVKKTIAEVENIDYIELAENLDIGTIINKKLIAASHIYQMTLDDDALNVKCLTYADALVVEFNVKEGDKITKTRIRDIKLPSAVNIGGLIRDGKGYIVTGDSVVQPNDHVVVFCMASSLRKLASFF
ncbi:MAG: Trk system potassium transporter TrkA [Sphingobacteriia bacterium]|jgi:trk system potassium uptake protein|nr:Trk system potassium transporter TrkA [Paludibacteraceae bacterium]NCA78900.1 Trk system potassium transporter TrkA [Sphingobacteriia bacterium]